MITSNSFAITMSRFSIKLTRTYPITIASVKKIGMEFPFRFNNNDDLSNHDKDEDGKTCADQQPPEHSKNHDPSLASHTKNSIPFRLPIPFP
jgi:hypothetical protein